MKELLSFKIGKSTYIIKSPNRREKEEADIFYAIKIGDFIKKGIATKAMLVKQYADTGGVLTNDELKDMQKLRRDYVRIQNEKTRLELKQKKTKTDEEKIEKFEQELIDILVSLQEFEMFHEDIFRHTADNLARNYLVLWWLTSLFYKKEKQEYTKIFKHDNFDDNLNDFDEIQESKDENLKQSCAKAISLIALWVSSKINTTEEFQEALKILDDN